MLEGEEGDPLGGPEARYTIPLPEAGEAKRAILDSYTKEHSAEYQAQAWIDLARRLGTERPELRDHLVMLLRKAMFNREEEMRLTAVASSPLLDISK